MDETHHEIATVEPGHVRRETQWLVAGFTHNQNGRQVWIETQSCRATVESGHDTLETH
jgi:hypothetical protein